MLQALLYHCRLDYGTAQAGQDSIGTHPPAQAGQDTLLPSLRRLYVSRTVMADIQHTFFTAPKYAVAGASNNTSKFGYILLQWYHSRGIPVTPVTPTSTEILGLECVSDVAKLSDKANTSLSIVTPPKVTRGILEQVLKEGELNAIWLQVSSAPQIAMLCKSCLPILLLYYQTT